MAIAISPRDGVSVSAPLRARQEDILRFVHQKSKWIIDKVEENQVIQARLRRKADAPSESEFLFLGKSHAVVVTSRNVHRPDITFDGLRWHVVIPQGISPTGALVQRVMAKWYRRQAEEILGGRVFHYSRMLGVEPKTIAVRSFKRVWGNCDYNTQTIQLNWQIILSPMFVVDYVVVHELCHLTVPNHSRRFWQRVEKFYPQYPEAKKWLKEHHWDMVLS